MDMHHQCLTTYLTYRLINYLIYFAGYTVDGSGLLPCIDNFANYNGSNSLKKDKQSFILFTVISGFSDNFNILFYQKGIKSVFILDVLSCS